MSRSFASPGQNFTQTSTSSSNHSNSTDMTSPVISAMGETSISNERSNQYTGPEDEKEAPVQVRKEITWCLENQDAILKLHSSEDPTNIFTHECCACKLFYKACMFSKSERKSNYPMCRWCRLIPEPTSREVRQQDYEFEIHRHIHCNTSRTRCYAMCSLEPPLPPVPVVKKELTLKDVAPEVEVAFTVKKKISQKEAKRLVREVRMN